jgi:hypothetical protein
MVSANYLVQFFSQDRILTNSLRQATRSPDQVSWYRRHLEISLALVERAAGGRSASVIDVGGGESTLVDDLLTRGYQNITVLDISQTASTRLVLLCHK